MNRSFTSSTSALAWLESGAVDAVVVAGASSESFGAPAPILCRTADEVLRGRRVKPSLCPSLSILDEVKAEPRAPRRADRRLERIGLARCN